MTSDFKLLIGSVSEEDRDISELQPIQCQHPKYESKSVCYLMGNSNIYEMQQFSSSAEDKCSLLLSNNLVFEENTILFVNRIDPLFLIIPALLKNKRDSCKSPIDTLLQTDNEKMIYCQYIQKEKQLQLICDIVWIADDLECVCLNDEKLLRWLRLKLERIEQSTKRDRLQALCLLNEYIPNSVFLKLCSMLEINPNQILLPTKKRKRMTTDTAVMYNKSNHNHNHHNKHSNQSNHNNNNHNQNKNFNNKKSNDFHSHSYSKPYSNRSSTQTKSTKQKQQLKGAPGMRSMMSYFTVKKKKKKRKTSANK